MDNYDDDDDDDDNDGNVPKDKKSTSTFSHQKSLSNELLSFFFSHSKTMWNQTRWIMIEKNGMNFGLTFENKKKKNKNKLIIINEE